MKSGLRRKFAGASWFPANGLERSFVRHISRQKSEALIWHESPKSDQVVLSVIIPTSDGYRHGLFPHLLDQISSQTLQDFELIVVRGDSRQGRAINSGVALAHGKYLLTLDDDTSLPDPATFEKLVRVMETHPDLGIAGGNNVIPENARHFVRRVMQELPRRSWKPVSRITDSDLAEHPCMIMRADSFKAVGGENELIPRGLDPYLREQFRRNGKRVVVVPRVIYHHMPPDNLAKLLRQFHRNGRHAAYVNRYYPEWIIETPANHGYFEARKPFIFRVLRFPFRLVCSLIESKPILFSCEVAYASGFIHELFFGKPQG
jgi:glycosyltransferase involved in cell wall biosynthesis